jgi:hypothetical protein
MIAETLDKQPYMVSVYEPKDAPDLLVFTFVPKGLQEVRGAGEAPKRVPQYIVLARSTGENTTFDWSRSADDPGAAKSELEREVQQRISARTAWVELVAHLVADVEQWAQELGWATRRIEKRLDDSQIGKHLVSALLMQDGTCRILLEPVGRSAPGAEGVVDLYLMPAYDDIASLYFYDNRWNLHYLFSRDPARATVRETMGVPLSKETLQRVLEEMKTNAA